MSSNEEYSSEDDEDYIPTEQCSSDDEEKADVDDNSVEQSKHVTESINKEEVDELWKNFKEKTKASNNDSKTIKKLPTSVASDVAASDKKDLKSEISSETDAKPTSPSALKKDTVVITKVYDFAGEEVKVTKEVKRDSIEAQKHLKEQSTSALSKGLFGRNSFGTGMKKRPGGGIGSVLGKLGKKPKLSTLEKSKLDWNKYKKREGIEDELQAYNKGKEGYLEKVSFLERTDMRQFEKERDMRLSKSGR